MWGLSTPALTCARWRVHLQGLLPTATILSLLSFPLPSSAGAGGGAHFGDRLSRGLRGPLRSAGGLQRGRGRGGNKLTRGPQNSASGIQTPESRVARWHARRSLRCIAARHPQGKARLRAMSPHLQALVDSDAFTRLMFAQINNFTFSEYPFERSPAPRAPGPWRTLRTEAPGDADAARPPPTLEGLGEYLAAAVARLLQAAPESRGAGALTATEHFYLYQTVCWIATRNNKNGDEVRRSRVSRVVWCVVQGCP